MRALFGLLYHEIPAAILRDNSGAIDIKRNYRLNDRSKHVDMHYHFIRELMESGKLMVIHINGKNNLADICTKAVIQAVRELLCSRIFGTVTSEKGC